MRALYRLDVSGHHCGCTGLKGDMCKYMANNMGELSTVEDNTTTLEQKNYPIVFQNGVLVHLQVNCFPYSLHEKGEGCSVSRSSNTKKIFLSLLLW